MLADVIILRISTKVINDTKGPNGCVPSLLLFGTLPGFPCTSSMNENQTKRFEYPKLARTII